MGASIVLLEFELFWCGCMYLEWYSPKRDFWDILLLVALQLLKDMESWVQLWLLQVRTFHVCMNLREQFNSFVFPCCFAEHENKKTILLFDAIKIWKYLVSSSSSSPLLPAIHYPWSACLQDSYSFLDHQCWGVYIQYVHKIKCNCYYITIWWTSGKTRKLI